MEDGTASTGGSTDRRKTVSGPFPNFEEPSDDAYVHFHDESMRLPWNAQLAPTYPASTHASSPSGRSTGRKRSFSGNILGRLNFLRSNSTGEDGRPLPRDKDQQPQSPKGAKVSKSTKNINDDNDGTVVSPVSPVKGENAMAAALSTAKTRKRKGSLRKTALLGGRRLIIEGRERKNSLLQRSPSKQHPPQLTQQPSPALNSTETTYQDAFPVLAQDNASNPSLRHELSYENISANTSSESVWSESAPATSARLSLVTDHTATQAGREESTELSSPLNLTSPVSQASYMSTTDDDDVLTFDSRMSSFGVQGLPIKKPLATGTSYFPTVASQSQESLSRRLSAKKSRSSPLSHSITSPSTYPEPEPHDYTETEYWGWVILFVTWLTFTVGMGSCLEIWSWAWDVGETPYAPPELEDDETLPIVGYYPALMVLTGVVAWIWITIAWLGMKYFRHAKIEV